MHALASVLFALLAPAIPEAVPGWPDLPDGLTLGGVPGVEVDAQGNVLFFHRGPEPILRFSPEGKLIRSFGGGLFDSAHGLRLDPEGNLWTTDNKNHTLVKLSPDGDVLLVLGERGVAGADQTHFNRPADIAFGRDGDLFIADGYGNSRVVRCDRNGKFIQAWGRKGTGEGEFDLPHAIRIDNEGLVYVGDRENNRVQVFDQEGRFIRQFGGFAPYGMAFTPGGELLIADGRANQVIMMTRSGEVLAEWGTKGSGPGQFNMPHGIAVGPEGAIYVSEVNGRRVQKFVVRPQVSVP